MSQQLQITGTASFNQTVGIGTINPRIALEAVGTDAASSSTATANGAIMVSNPIAANSQVMTMGVVNGSGNHSWIQSRNSTSALFYPLALNPVGGNVLIGTSTDAGYKLDVSSIGRFYNADQGSARVIIQNTGSGGQAVNLIAGNPNVDQTGFSIAYGNTNFLRFNSTGIATFSSLAGSGSRTVNADANGTLSASSDSSLKQEDITHQIEGLAEILQLKPRAYKWLSDIEIRGKEAVTEIGFFANEVNSIIPSAAPIGKDGLYGFYDRAIIASLVKGMQEQQAQIEELKALISNK